MTRLDQSGTLVEFANRVLDARITEIETLLNLYRNNGTLDGMRLSNADVMDRIHSICIRE